MPRGQHATLTHWQWVAGNRRGRSDAAMIAHITPLEAPIVWFAFVAGIAVGAFATWILMQRATRRS